MTALLVVKLSLLFIFFLFSAFFSGIETALTSLSTLNLKQLKEKHVSLMKYFELWESNPSKFISVILIGNNLCNIGIGVLSVSIGMDIVLDFGWNPKIVYTLISVGCVAVTVLFCEILPKVFSRYNAEKVAVLSISLLMLIYRLLQLPNKLMLQISNFIISLSGSKATSELAFLSPEDLRILLLSDETIPISKPARKIIKNIFDFGKTKIRRVMIPRIDVSAVNLDQPPDKIVEQILEKGYSRIPVYRGNLDNIVGIIYSKDLLLAWRGGALFVIEDLIRPAYFVPDSAKLDKVLREFRAGHQHMAIVVNEFGSMAGLATIEDIVEEIVGEIWDEYDIQEKTIFPLPDGTFLVRASESLEKVNDELHFNLPSADFNTVSGWVLDMFGRIPKVGDTIKWGNLQIEIIEADKRKISRIKIQQLKDLKI